MPITRTPIVDDDGTGTTGTVLNNAWKQQFYDQIDAHVSAMEYFNFTPIDASGAGLVFTSPSGMYLRLGPLKGNPSAFLIHFQLYVVYPSTSNGLNASIGGLPYAVHGANGAAATQGYGIHRIWQLVANTTRIAIYNASTGGLMTNADMTGSGIILSGLYFT